MHALLYALLDVLVQHVLGLLLLLLGTPDPDVIAVPAATAAPRCGRVHRVVLLQCGGGGGEGGEGEEESRWVHRVVCCCSMEEGGGGEGGGGEEESRWVHRMALLQCGGGGAGGEGVSV